MTEKLDRLARGFRKRTLVTARLASKVGLKALKKTVGLNGAPVDEEKAVAAAGELVRQLGSLKGVVMKFGQMASYMPGAMPPAAQRVLTELQAQSTAMVFERVRDVVQKELGGAPGELFETFEEEPFAAASIGQVHRARFEGSDVAVKVQYPEIEELLGTDLKTLRLFSQMSSFGTAVDGKAVADELRERTLEECDYLAEARNQRFFRSLLADNERCHVPAVVDARSARRVITTELVDATSFYPFCENAERELRNRAGETIFETCFDSIFRRCVYNADPHPGNYLFHDDGRVTFLDYGCVRWFEPDMIDRWKRVARSVVDDKRDEYRDAFVDLGLVAVEKSFDWDYQWDVMRYLYRPFTQREPFTYTHDYVSESYDLMIFKNPNKMKTALPPEWLFLNRLQWGMNSVLAHLGAAGRWPELWRAAIESETQPVARPAS